MDAAALAQLAELAKLNIPDTDLAEVGARIDNVLRLVDQLKAADLHGVKPMAHPLDAVQRLRPDAVTETDAREPLQAVAPAVEAGLYLVPKVID